MSTTDAGGTPLLGHADRPITTKMSKEDLIGEIALWKCRYEAVHEQADELEKENAELKRKLKDKLTFEQGYVCAVATLIRQHGEPAIAKDLLGCISIKDWSEIDQYDQEPLKKHSLIKLHRSASTAPETQSSTPQTGNGGGT